MGEKRKFSALAGIRQQQPTEQSEVPPPPPAMKTGPGRPVGKRSDPSFQPTTVLLRRATKRAAVRKLEDENINQDLSELIEHLLSQWIKQNEVDPNLETTS